MLSKDGQGSVIQVSIVMSSGVAPRLCTGQALCQLPCLFCPVLAFWSWGGRIFLEGKQPKPCTTLLLGQGFARQDSLSPVFFWMPEEPTAKSSVWAQAPLTMLLHEKPLVQQLHSGGLPSRSVGNALGNPRSFCQLEPKESRSCRWHI